MILGIRLPAGQWERFTGDAAAGMVGKKFTAKIEDAPVGEGTVLEARIVDEGSAIELLVEWPDNPPDSEEAPAA